jgi:hypothetical protein
MIFRMQRWRTTGVFFSATLAVCLCSCESDRPSRRDGGAEAAVARAPVPEMEAHAMFLAGQIETDVLLGRAGFPARPAARADAASGGRGGGGFRGGVGGGGGRRGGMGGGRGGGGGDASGERGSAAARSADGPVPNIHPVNETPVRFHLRLTNHGTEPIEVEVADFNSDLGNFVVQPRKISLPPGEPIEAEPMVSQLGIKAEEIPLTITIRANGRSEKQVLALRVKPDPAPVTLPPPTSSP